MRLTALALYLLVHPALPAAPNPVPGSLPTGQQVLEQMRKRYDGRWYRTATFVQKTTHADGSVETWYEALQIPGLLRIDIAPLDSGRALLFRHDSIYEMAHGTIKSSGPFVHPLMILGFDVYFDAAERTAQRLSALGFDLGQVSENSWMGKPVWVIGAQAGDTTKKQFWIEKDRLVFVRMLELSPKGKLVETIFDGYQKLGGGWIETVVTFLTDGVQRGKEEYSDPKADVVLPAELFDPARWGKAAWIESGKP